MCAPAVALSGLLALSLGSKWYPQQYSQFPIAFLYVPLGFVLGFLGAAAVKLIRPHWTAVQMCVVVNAFSLGYSALMMSASRENARPAQVAVVIEPDSSSVVPCSPATCPSTDPPLEWTVQGTLRIQEKAGLGGTVEAIEMTSYSWAQVARAQRGRAVRSTVSGPQVRYTPRQLDRPSRVAAGEIVSYPLRYSYRTESGDSRRTISVVVQFIDRAGRRATGRIKWTVS